MPQGTQNCLFSALGFMAALFTFVIGVAVLAWLLYTSLVFLRQSTRYLQYTNGR